MCIYFIVLPQLHCTLLYNGNKDYSILFYMRNNIQYQDNQARAKSVLTIKKRHLYKLQLEWHSVENILLQRSNSPF